MCGLAGVYHYADAKRPVDPELVARMTRALAHRGPDDEAFLLRGPVGFGHRRLAIVDPSASGRQPMVAADGQAFLTYNGELFNHAALRPALLHAGYRFAGSCDTETLLCLLHHAGPQALRDQSGIFAYAYYDARTRQLVLGRDPMGVKQLYYYDDGERVLFASEIKALLTCREVPRQLDSEALNQYLHFHTPLFERTFFAGIRAVRPGHTVTFSPHGARQRSFWQLGGLQHDAMSESERVEALRALLTQVVHDQLLGDVPVGAFFSGGLDSCALAALARARQGRLRGFGVHFRHPEVIDERPYQEAAARAAGVELELITLQPQSLPDDLQRLMFVQDQPMVGPAMVPMYHLSALARRHVKVCLGGQGADETFGGYARYALARPLRALAPGTRARRSGATLLKQLASARNVRRLLRNAARPTAASRYFNTFATVPNTLWRALSNDASWFSRQAAQCVFDDTLRAAPEGDICDKLMYWDVQTYLPGLFHQDDRMSMAHGLESRVPFADVRLVRFALRTPMRFKLRQGATKWLLRQAVADLLPNEVLSRRKVGFDTPIPAWLRQHHRDFLHDVLLSSRARQRGLWDSKAVARLLGAAGHAYWFDVTWKMLCIELWAQSFLDVPVSLPQRVSYG